MSPIALPIAELKPALTGLAKVINRHSALPVLNHLKIERTSDGWVALTATDLDHFVTVRLEQPAPGDSFAILVPYEELLKTLKGRGKGEEILIEPGENNMATVRYAIGDQFAETRIATLPVEEFPPHPAIKGEPIPVENSLRTSIREALQCSSTDETRLIINGAYVDVSKPEAHYVVGTDGRHLYSSNSFALPLSDSLLIPNHRFLGWKEFNADGEWQLRVGAKDKEKDNDAPPPFQLTSRRWRFISRQFEGNYPNWRQVLPSGSSTQTTIELAPEAVESLLQTIGQMPDHDAINHAIGLEVIGYTARLLGRSSQDDVWTRVAVPGVKVTGKEVTIFLNREILSKALRFGLTRIDLIDSMSPLRFSHDGRQMIVMPTRPTPAPNAPNPTSSASPVAAADSEPQPSTPPPKAESQERKSMPDQNGTTTSGTSNGTTTATAEKPALETALAQIETIRGEFRSTIAGLNKLADALKQAQREQKASDKEIQSVRQTLRSLKSVRI
ncbi:MAG: hypothetical protein QOE70_5364 [Chthoniobacter sp.]|jgi:DNA polymerase III sliding clamp (beta) subunit (PCNA family)|nr:hypothetical protein [Chthoniobacter sp.]